MSCHHVCTVARMVDPFPKGLSCILCFLWPQWGWVTLEVSGCFCDHTECRYRFVLSSSIYFHPTANHTPYDNIVTNSAEGATGSCSQQWKPFNDTATNAAVVMWPLMGPLTELFWKAWKCARPATGCIINNKPSPYAAVTEADSPLQVIRAVVFCFFFLGWGTSNILLMEKVNILTGRIWIKGLNTQYLLILE